MARSPPHKRRMLVRQFGHLLGDVAGLSARLLANARFCRVTAGHSIGLFDELVHELGQDLLGGAKMFLVDLIFPPELHAFRYHTFVLVLGSSSRASRAPQLQLLLLITKA